jgi:hypothetical protein
MTASQTDLLLLFLVTQPDRNIGAERAAVASGLEAEISQPSGKIIALQV